MSRAVIPVARPAYLTKLHRRLAQRVPIWVVTKDTMEYPGLYAARMHVLLPRSRPTRFVLAHRDLDGLRDLLPPGLARMRRHWADPPEIVESWV